MTLRAVFNVSKLCSFRFAAAVQCFATTRRVYCPILLREQSLRVFTVSLCRAATTDTEERTVRWLPRKKKTRFRGKRRPVAEHCGDPPSSVLVDMLASPDSNETAVYNASLNAVRTEVDAKLKELEEMANTEIRDIDLAVEVVDENTDEEATEQTEVRLL